MDFIDKEMAIKYYEKELEIISKDLASAEFKETLRKNALEMLRTLKGK